MTKFRQFYNKKESPPAGNRKRRTTRAITCQVPTFPGEVPPPIQSRQGVPLSERMGGIPCLGLGPFRGHTDTCQNINFPRTS